MNRDDCAAIITAFNDGKKSDVVDLLNSLGADALSDPFLIQIMALSRRKRIEEHCLLEMAAYDCPVIEAQALFNLGVSQQEQGMSGRALLSYSQVLRLDPVHTGALNNLSDLLRLQGRSEEAWQAIGAYLSAGARPHGLEIRIAKIADDCGLSDEAEAWFARAAASDPDNRQIAWEWAMQLLRDEKFAAGWGGYESRRQIFSHDALAIVRYSAPQWDGSALRGQTLLVHKEQGLGDTIMFASCLLDIVSDRHKLHLAVQPPLVRLFKGSFPDAEVWPSTSNTNAEGEEHQSWRNLAVDLDLQVPFGSLPLIFRSEQHFPRPKPYLRPSKSDVALWRERLAALSPARAGTLRAGLVISARRSVSAGPGIAEGPPKCLPAHLAADLANPAFTWFGLHDLSTACDLAEVPKLDVIDTSPWLYDLADTAALIANLDLVVAVDTAVAHLAGAMGKKVLLMLRRHSDWRWGRTRNDSYWYHDVEVFRQRDEGHWSPVVVDVARRLAAIADERGNSCASSDNGREA